MPPDEHPDPEGNEGDEALSAGAHILRGPLVDVDLSGEEEEVVADPVEDDPDVGAMDSSTAMVVEHHDKAVAAMGAATLIALKEAEKKAAKQSAAKQAASKEAAAKEAAKKPAPKTTKKTTKETK